MSTVFDKDHGPTYVIGIANPHEDLESEIATILGNGHGCSISHGRGLWMGNWEDDCHIRLQCVPHVLEGFLACMAVFYPDEDYYHVERHDVPTSYVDLHQLRSTL